MMCYRVVQITSGLTNSLDLLLHRRMWSRDQRWERYLLANSWHCCRRREPEGRLYQLRGVSLRSLFLAHLLTDLEMKYRRWWMRGLYLCFIQTLQLHTFTTTYVRIQAAHLWQFCLPCQEILICRHSKPYGVRLWWSNDWHREPRACY